MTRASRTLVHVVRADFLERVRRHGFIVTLALTLYGAYAFLPPADSIVATLQIGGHRGVYNSAWVGCAVAMLATTFLSMIGFYLVKNAVERDRRTGVGQILATTPLSKPLYTLGKAGSNFAVLATLVLLLAVGAMGMQWLRGEDRHIDPIATLLPFLVLTLPALATVSAVSVLFECIPWLRGGLGNVVYMFLVTGGIGATASHHVTGVADFMGVSTVLPAMIRGVADHFPGVDPVNTPMSMGFNFRQSGPWNLTTFAWSGPEWTAGMLASRFAWFGIAIAIALVASLPFDRFDTAMAAPRGKRARARKADEAEPQAPAAEAITGRGGAALSAHALTAVTRRSFGLLPLLRAEMALMLNGTPWAWWLIPLGLLVASAFAPLVIARGWLLPIAWVWPVLKWSPLGARETLHQTEGLLFSSPRPLLRQLSATWLSGVLLALALGAAVGVRLALAGDVAGVASIVIGACFVPALALACGTWTGNGRMFEVVYLLLWYIGPMNRLAPADFIGGTPGSLAAAAPQRFAVLTLAALAVAVAGRQRRLSR